MNRLCKRKGRGFVLVSAVFLLVILSSLGVFLLSVSNTQKLTSAQDMQGSRAYWMAIAGIQWVAGAINASITGACATNTLTLDGFSVTMTCKNNVYTEGTTPVNVYWLTATASIGGIPGSIAYTERMITVFDF